VSAVDTVVRVGRKAAGRTHDRPRSALAVAIADLESGMLQRFWTYSHRQTSTVIPFPAARKPAPQPPSPARGPDAV
jgi:hypothetical protein